MPEIDTELFEAQEGPIRSHTRGRRTGGGRNRSRTRLPGCSGCRTGTVTASLTRTRIRTHTRTHADDRAGLRLHSHSRT
jgi:hypothetical protein